MSMFDLETTVKACKGCDPEIDITISLNDAQEAIEQFKRARTALRRICSLDDKNVLKYAKDIARDGLIGSHEG